jgi:hypothetical protein
MSNLLEKYFGNEEETETEIAQLRQQEAFEAERTREFLSVGYMGDFKKWLTDTAFEAEPTLGSHEEMIYKTGLRDGVRLVERRLVELERDLERRNRG